MALKSKIAKLEDVEEQFRGLYVQVKDGYELAIEGVETHSAYGSINGQLEALKSKFKDVDPAKYQELVTAENEYKQLEAKINEAKESVTKQLTTQFTTKETTLNATIKELEEALHEALVVSAATAAISKVAPDSVDLLLPHVTAQMKVVKNKDGKREAVILDDKGQPRVVTTKDGVKNFALWHEAAEGEEAVPSLLAEMSENKKFMGAFPAVNKGGGGADPNTSAAGAAAGGGGNGVATVKIPRTLATSNYTEYKRLSESAKKEGKGIELTD